MELKWNQPQDQSYEAGLDRGVIYLDSGGAVPWNGLSSVEDGGESTVSEFYLDGIKYLAVVSPRDWKGTLEAYTYPNEFAELIGIAELGDGLHVDSQAPDRFDLSYRTMVGDNADTTPQYKIHLIYHVMASLGSFTNQTLTSDSTDPTLFEFDLSAVPIQIPNLRPSAHIILDTREIDPNVITDLEAILYGDSTNDPSMPEIQQLMDLLTFGDTVIVVDNGDGTWTATGSKKNVYMTDRIHFEIDNVAANYLTDEIYEFVDGGGGVNILTLVADTDGVPYYILGADMSHVDIDSDGVPYFTAGPSDTSLLLDTDGVPYYKN